MDNLPMGSKNDPDAPWNQSDSSVESDAPYYVRVTLYGEIEVGDSHGNEGTIDPVDLNKYLHDQLDFRDEDIEIYDIEESDRRTNSYNIDTSHGNAVIYLGDLLGMLKPGL